jgi:hypothetical protein
MANEGEFCRWAVGEVSMTRQRLSADLAQLAKLAATAAGSGFASALSKPHGPNGWAAAGRCHKSPMTWGPAWGARGASPVTTTL